MLKSREAEATATAKQIEKDMVDFGKNKDSKLKELEKSLADLKKSLSKNSSFCQSHAEGTTRSSTGIRTSVE